MLRNSLLKSFPVALIYIAFVCACGCQKAESAKVATSKAANAETLVTRLNDAVAHGFKYTAKSIIADLEKIDPENARLPELRQKTEALPEPEETLTVELTAGVKLDLTLIHPGTFLMGSVNGDSYERPAMDEEAAGTDAKASSGKDEKAATKKAKQHQVHVMTTIGRPYYLDKFEVTQEQWDAVIGLDPLQTMARGVLERMKQAQAKQSGPIPSKAVEKILAEQWKAVVGDLSKATPPTIIMSKAASDQWQAIAEAADAEKIGNAAKSLAAQWKQVGLESLSGAVAEHVKAAMGNDPSAVPPETIAKIMEEEWSVTMGANPLETIARVTTEEMKKTMSKSENPVTGKRVHSLLSEQWKTVMDASPHSAVPLDKMSEILAEEWKAAQEDIKAKTVHKEAIEKAVSAQWKSAVTAAQIDKMANDAVDQLKKELGTEPDPALIERTKKAIAAQWKTAMGADTATSEAVKAMTNVVEDQWKTIIGAIPTDKIAKAAAERWKPLPGADPVAEMAKLFAEDWKAMSGKDPNATPIDKIEKSAAKKWKSVMGSNPIDKTAELVAEDWHALTSANCRFHGAKLPMDTVSWVDCREFVKRLSCMLPEYEFRFPNEAEWEYACRAGTTTEYYFGDDAKSLGDYAWFEGNSAEKSHQGGDKQPNAWGLYDMSGDLYEWTLSVYKPYGQDRDENNKVIPFSEGDGGKEALTSPHAVRGGYWGSDAKTCRSTYRLGFAPKNRYYSFGFRVAVSVK